MSHFHFNSACFQFAKRGDYFIEVVNGMGIFPDRKSFQLFRRNVRKLGMTIISMGQKY